MALPRGAQNPQAQYKARGGGQSKGGQNYANSQSGPGSFNPDIRGFYGGSTPRSDIGSTGMFDTQGKANLAGTGARGLPSTFTGWGAPARYGAAIGADFAMGAQPAIDLLKGQMGKNYQQELYGISKDTIEGQFAGAKAQQGQAQSRSGTGGGAAISPATQYGLQIEASARSGALGQAARMSVIQAEQMQQQASMAYMNALTQRFQALLTPAQMQLAGKSDVPVGQPGPSPTSWIRPAADIARAAID